MTESKEEKAKAVSRAEQHFAASAEKDASLREKLAAAKAKNLAKMAQLRALRIARDAEAVDSAQAGAPRKKWGRKKISPAA